MRHLRRRGIHAPLPGKDSAMSAARFARFAPVTATLCACLALLAPTHAATLTVTSAADDGSAGTLRAVLASASAGDTITFALAPRTVITLTQGSLPIGKVLHIVGPTGGGIFLDGSRAFQILTITAGTASRPVTLANLTLRHGSNSGGLGGGFSNRGAVSLKNCTLAYNTASEGGGGFFSSGTAILADCTLIGNSSTGSNGGGISNNNGTLYLTNCTITVNTAFGIGGGISTLGGLMRLHRCTFSRNHAEAAGGLFVSTRSPAIVTNCIFTNNHATSGGGISKMNGSLSLTNCTFAGNSATQFGGGFYHYGDQTTLTNDIFYGDTAKSSGNEIYNNSGNVTVQYCDVQGGYAGTGNFDADPQFVSASVPYDLRLQANSPCIDAGTPDGAPPYNRAPPYDRAGNPRDPNAPDVGAFKFQP